MSHCVCVDGLSRFFREVFPMREPSMTVSHFLFTKAFQELAWVFVLLRIPSIKGFLTTMTISQDTLKSAYAPSNSNHSALDVFSEFSASRRSRLSALRNSEDPSLRRTSIRDVSCDTSSMDRRRARLDPKAVWFSEWWEENWCKIGYEAAVNDYVSFIVTDYECLCILFVSRS